MDKWVIHYIDGTTSNVMNDSMIYIESTSMKDNVYFVENLSMQDGITNLLEGIRLGIYVEVRVNAGNQSITYEGDTYYIGGMPVGEKEARLYLQTHYTKYPDEWEMDTPYIEQWLQKHRIASLTI